VFLWWKRGGLRGERGALAHTFSGAKNAPRFSDLFLGLVVGWWVVVAKATATARATTKAKAATKATTTTKANTGVLRFAQDDTLSTLDVVSA
jgi:hypothetical protein